MRPGSTCSTVTAASRRRSSRIRPGTNSSRRRPVLDGWQVRKQPVNLGLTVSGIFEVPQGMQALVFIPAGGVGTPPGQVCRPIATVAGHAYQIVFKAVSVGGPTPVIVKLGTASRR